MTSKTPLTPVQEKKLASVIAGLENQRGLVNKNDDEAKKRLRRFVDKHARHALKVRGTGPHSHGFNAEQRKQIRAAVNEALGIKAPERKPATPTKVPAKSGGKGKTRKTTAQLAAEQKARAEQS